MSTSKTSRLWQHHAELRRTPHGGYDFAQQRVQQHYLDLVAERMMQFEAPPEAMKRGYNQVDVQLVDGGKQKVIWLEAYVLPDE